MDTGILKKSNFLKDLSTYESKSIFCHSIQQAQSNRMAEWTQITKVLFLIDSHIELTCAKPNY